MLSKLLERVVARQLLEYLSSAHLLPPLQSGFRQLTRPKLLSFRYYMTFYWLLTVKTAALTLLDLSAAFDTVDHDILLQRLQTCFRMDDAVLGWFRSYLTGRTQYVRRDVTRSYTIRVVCGVPQGSVLGPILFILCTQLTWLH